MIKSSSDHENLTFKIGPDDVGVRLDAFLASQIEGWSRARLQRLIEAEDVLVNGKFTKPSYKLREHDELEVELTTPATTSFTPEAIPIEIVYEDDTLVVVNKPAGLVVHPAAGMHSGTATTRAPSSWRIQRCRVSRGRRSRTSKGPS